MIDKSKLTPTNLKCKWDIDNEGGKKCTSEVYEVSILNNLIKVIACTHHLKDHINIIDLLNYGYNWKEVYYIGCEKRKELLSKTDSLKKVKKNNY